MTEKMILNLGKDGGGGLLKLDLFLYSLYKQEVKKQDWKPESWWSGRSFKQQQDSQESNI